MKALRQVYGETLAELGAENERIVVLDADLSKSTKTAIFAASFPDRFFDIGIAEQDMMSTAAGLAAAGLVPFVSTFAIFATGRAWEQLRNSVCYARLPVRVVATHAGISVGEDGATHQANEDLAVTRAIPNLSVVVPCDEEETRQTIRAAAAYDSGPIYVRLGRSTAPDVHDATYKFELGKADRLREGTDVSLFACGLMVSRALDAAKTLAAEGIHARVVNLSTIKPLDLDEVRAAAEETGAIVTAEEHNVFGGMGSAVAEAVVSQGPPVPMAFVGLQDTFGESGPFAALFEKYGLTAEAIANAARGVIARKPGEELAGEALPEE